MASFFRSLYSQLAPLGALLPAAWITADRLIAYVGVYGPAAVVMAGAIELLGLQIVATRTKLIGLNMPEQMRSMNLAFAGYLLIIVAVNGVLAVAHLTGWVDWGRVVAELILGLMALPVSARAGVEKQLKAIDERAAQDKAATERAIADARDERERALTIANKHEIELLETKARLRAEAKKADNAPATKKQPKNKLRRPVTTDALIAEIKRNPGATDAQIGATFGVSRQAIQKRREKLTPAQLGMLNE